MPVPKSFLSFVACLFLAALTAYGAELAVPDDVLFESGVEYANPDNQHLQLNIARPKK